MKENKQKECILPEYERPEFTLIRLGKEDILTSSSIYLPVQPIGGDPLQHS